MCSSSIIDRIARDVARAVARNAVRRRVVDPPVCPDRSGAPSWDGRRRAGRGCGGCGTVVMTATARAARRQRPSVPVCRPSTPLPLATSLEVVPRPSFARFDRDPGDRTAADLAGNSSDNLRPVEDQVNRRAVTRSWHYRLVQWRTPNVLERHLPNRLIAAEEGDAVATLSGCAWSSVGITFLVEGVVATTTSMSACRSGAIPKALSRVTLSRRNGSQRFALMTATSGGPPCRVEGMPASSTSRGAPYLVGVSGQVVTHPGRLRSTLAA